MQNQTGEIATSSSTDIQASEIQCKACGTRYHGLYCPACGQKHIARRFNMRDSIAHLFGTVFNFDKGLWFTSIQLIVNPGKVIREYLNGITSKYFHPFRFLFLWLTLQVFIMLVGGIMQDIQEQYASSVSGREMTPAAKDIMLGLNSYLHILIAISMPVLAGGSRLFFRKAGYNYAEHLIINCFAYGQTVLLGILIMPLYFVNTTFFGVTNLISLIISVVYFTYVYVSFFGGSKWLSVLKAIGSYIIWFIGFGLIQLIAFAIYVARNIGENPDLLDEIFRSNR